ncbi:MAG: hypothetical protein A3D96_00390 [Chlamydiae bacterium RIFCSPHIGHO2_12_FULL_44_59]|nr:MAG: hypothetical protein A2796_07535 [Chlamydiae bacterium RIFCSPHIGHO2_01_FULL_44_39]OGN60839.1 MAG: hypothetical protein A3D96_00390 [Chlamydiae bacterium RIFCSPHIGHO2_12_FULL_44_59]OGN66715.1 MAG: hypothetical protein A2978_03025 [Chlamydiae bacterium RIFCSPLOWO2_01_FULL_44_52]OGN67365.1 MAG: hypothetical protein A3I67_06220 [Chlamydiae bacterium RIFCSPLOWO2_02_FULL_45_22]OGN70640.1 MAG: hypothetical protein A3F79_07135 [Chlamydiae bacterium RIFCSPLOWO2_12_FULL_45_20]
MDSLLLSRITQDFLTLDHDQVSPKERFRAGWGGSILISHEKAPRRKRKRRSEVEYLLGERKRASRLFAKGAVDLSTAPKLASPKAAPEGSLSPATPFFRGILEIDRKKNPEPISYLLTETHEFSRARPVPGAPKLLRSLCRGKGVLKRSSQGLVYLDLDNQFISIMLPYLKAHRLIRPPYFNLLIKPEGAHIPVIPAREAAFQYLDAVEELEQPFVFEVDGLYSMKPSTWPEVEEAWFFTVSSPDLEKLRRKYFLPEHPNGHPFHIVIAVKPGTQKTQPHPLMRINASMLVA